MSAFPEFRIFVDIVPAILCLALVFSLVSFVAAISSRAVTPAALSWAGGGMGVAGGLLLIVLRGHIPDLASILAGNCALILGHATMSYGTSRFGGRNGVPDVVVGLAFAAGFVGIYFADGGLSARVALVATALILLSIRMLRGFLARPLGLGTILAIAVLAATSLLETGRIINLLAQGTPWADPQMMNALSLRLGVPGALGISLAVVAVNWPAFRRLFDAAKPDAEGAGPGVWQLATDRSVLIAPEGQQLRLTGNEYVVLQRLASSSEPIDRLTLNALIGRDNANPKDRGIDILLSRLRRKCADAGVELPINSVRGRGYVFHGDLPLV